MGFVKVCSMFFLSFAKQNQAEVWPRFPTLLKLLLWTKVVEWLKVLNALGPLCLWQCFLLIFFVYGSHVMVYWVLPHSLNWTGIFFSLFFLRVSSFPVWLCRFFFVMIFPHSKHSTYPHILLFICVQFSCGVWLSLAAYTQWHGYKENPNVLNRVPMSTEGKLSRIQWGWFWHDGHGT